MFCFLSFKIRYTLLYFFTFGAILMNLLRLQSTELENKG